MEAVNSVVNESSLVKGSYNLWRLQFDLWQQWTEWFSKGYNWKNFCLIEIAYEFEPYVEGHEFQFGLLGLNCRLTYWYGKRGSGASAGEKHGA